MQNKYPIYYQVVARLPLMTPHMAQPTRTQVTDMEQTMAISVEDTIHLEGSGVVPLPEDSWDTCLAVVLIHSTSSITSSLLTMAGVILATAGLEAILETLEAVSSVVDHPEHQLVQLEPGLPQVSNLIFCYNLLSQLVC